MGFTAETQYLFYHHNARLEIVQIESRSGMKRFVRENTGGK